MSVGLWFKGPRRDQIRSPTLEAEIGSAHGHIGNIDSARIERSYHEKYKSINRHGSGMSDSNQRYLRFRTGLASVARSQPGW